MDPILETGAAAIAAGYLVAFLKLAAPRAPSWALAAVAVLSGIACSALVALAAGGELDVQSAARTILTGIGAAAVAAGLTRTDAAGEGRREGVEEAEG